MGRQDAILFLKQLNGEKENYIFTDSANPDRYIQYSGDLPEGYTLGTRNPVWLPVAATSTSYTPAGPSSRRSVGGGQPASGLNIITENDDQGSPVISQRDLRDAITWLAGPSQSGGASTQRSSNSRATERYQACISFALSFIRWERDKDAYFGPAEKPTRWDFQMDSGLTQGTEIFGMSFGTERGAGYAAEDVDYDTHTISGESAHLFQSLVTDADANPVTGYSYAVTTLRPLPAGVYSFRHEVTLFEDVPCNFNPENVYKIVSVKTAAPPGTVHEAFFDPATTTAGVGYLATTSTSTGVLEPAGFSVSGRAIAITGLTWQNGRVVLTLDRFGSWLDGFSFIEPDGTVGLRLAEVDATKDWTARTLTWEVSEQPWESGDELMMRMGPIPLPAVRNLTAEANSAGEAVLRWEVAYGAGVSGYRIWRHQPGEGRGAKDLCIGHAEHGYDVHGREQPRSQPDGVQGAGDRQGLQRRGEFRVCSGRQPVGGTCESQDQGAGCPDERPPPRITRDPHPPILDTAFTAGAAETSEAHCFRVVPSTLLLHVIPSGGGAEESKAAVQRTRNIFPNATGFSEDHTLRQLVALSVCLPPTRGPARS